MRAFRVVERGTDDHCIDRASRMAIEAGVKIHYGVKVDPSDCDIMPLAQKSPVQSRLVRSSRPITQITSRSN